MAVFLVMMVAMRLDNADDVITGCDFVIPIVGAVPAMLLGVALYMSHRAQRLREQSFGEPLRDQLGRQIARLDYLALRAVWLGGALVAAGFAGWIAIVVANSRVNNERFDDWGRVVGMILVGAIVAGIAVRAARRRATRDVLPRKRRLEALLKELDDR